MTQVEPHLLASKSFCSYEEAVSKCGQSSFQRVLVVDSIRESRVHLADQLRAMKLMVCQWSSLSLSSGVTSTAEALERLGREVQEFYTRVFLVINQGEEDVDRSAEIRSPFICSSTFCLISSSFVLSLVLMSMSTVFTPPE